MPKKLRKNDMIYFIFAWDSNKKDNTFLISADREVVVNSIM